MYTANIQSSATISMLLFIIFVQTALAGPTPRTEQPTPSVSAVQLDPPSSRPVITKAIQGMSKF